METNEETVPTRGRELNPIDLEDSSTLASPASDSSLSTPDTPTETFPTDTSSVPVETSPLVGQLQAAATDQSPAEPQQVPEVRPQGSIQPSPFAQSDAGLRAAAADPGAHGEAEYEAAKSTPESEAAADEAGQTTNLLVGQRVQITGDHPEAGRMGLVQSILYTDPIQAMIAAVGGVESRFAKVYQYVLLTRDGRSDTLTATPDQVKPLEENNGWGRGTI